MVELSVVSLQVCRRKTSRIVVKLELYVVEKVRAGGMECAWSPKGDGTSFVT